MIRGKSTPRPKQRQASATATSEGPVVSKRDFRRRRIFVVLLGSFLLWSAVTLWNQVDKLSERGEKLETLDQKLKETAQVNDFTKREVARLNDQEYIEQRIRKDLHYVKPWETLFYVPRDPKQ